MTSRYGTLDVSMNLSKSGLQKKSRTIDITEKDDESSSKGENDEKVNKFKELYFKNEKLRKQLKLLNEKLNEKLEKLKLPAVNKHRALSVDLNKSPPNPPSKALVRELENGYKQIAMYKKQVQVLKGKEETPQNYDKFRNIENMISYMDMEINQVQQQLKSIKNVKKIQEKVLQEDVDNVQLKQRLTDYQKQIKNFKEKMKQIDRKSRKRDEEFKKQQAYLVVIKSKVRKFEADEREQDKPEIQKPKQANKDQFLHAKDQFKRAKIEYEEACRKTDTMRRNVKNIREQTAIYDQQWRDKQALYKLLLVQVESYTRLLKDLETKKYEQTGVREDSPARMKQHSKFLKLEQIEDDDNLTLSQPNKNQQLGLSKLSSIPNNTSKDERQWKGKMRKVSMGYSNPTDQMFQQNGMLIGLKAYLDENRYITGLAAILYRNQMRVESKVYGNMSNIQLKWEIQPGDQILRIAGSFTEQGYLAEIVLISRNGLNSRFGSTQHDIFQFKLEENESFNGIFGGFRALGQDIRITEIGFWINKF